MNDLLQYTDPLLEEIWAIREESSKRYEEDPKKWIEDLIAFANELEGKGLKVVNLEEEFAELCEASTTANKIKAYG